MGDDGAPNVEGLDFELLTERYESNTEAAVGKGSEEAPIYRKSPHDDGWATQLFMIVCDEGWRESIVCTHMYEWAADWLVEVLGHRPYAPGKP